MIKKFLRNLFSGKKLFGLKQTEEHIDSTMTGKSNEPVVGTTNDEIPVDPKMTGNTEEAQEAVRETSELDDKHNQPNPEEK